MKRPAAEVLMKRPAAKALVQGSAARVPMQRPGLERLKTQRARLPQEVRAVLDKVDEVRQIQEDEYADLRVHVLELEQLYHIAAQAGVLRAQDQIEVLCVAVTLTDLSPRFSRRRFGRFLGEALMSQIFSNMNESLNLNLVKSGRSVLLRACVLLQECGCFVQWDPICFLAAHPRFACLDVVPVCDPMFLGCGCHVCLDEDILLALIQRNRDSPDPKVRATVNHVSWTWSDRQTLLQLICGAYSGQFTATDYRNIDPLIEDAGEENGSQVGRNLPETPHLRGSAAVVKALLEHPAFTAVNYVDGDESFSALHILLSISGGVAGAPECSQRTCLGHLSHCHLPWDEKLAYLDVFLNHAEMYPGQIDFMLRCGLRTYTQKWLPAEMAYHVRFPADIVRRLGNLTLPGLPSKVMRVPQVVQCILKFV